MNPAAKKIELEEVRQVLRDIKPKGIEMPLSLTLKLMAKRDRLAEELGEDPIAKEDR